MPYEGILLIDKPQGFTSFDVIAKLRGMTKTRKIGHSGTLDPMATGVLPVFFGRAAKAVSILPREDKRYLAQVQLGITTDTQDLTGKILEKQSVQADPEEIIEAARHFSGEIQQIPPMYSALKVNGKKLCDLARQGIEIERQPRPVTVYSLSVRLLKADLLELDVHCSKGTYIRTLAADLGEKLGCGAALSALRRTMAAGFGLEECLSLEEAQALGNGLAEKLLPIETAFSGLPQVQLSQKQARLFQNGVRLKTDQIQIHDPGRKAVFSEEGFLGTAFLEAGGLRMEKLFRLADG